MKILITGATSGIGRCVANLLAAEGVRTGVPAQLLLVGRDRRRLREATEELNRLGAHASGFEADLAERDAPAAMAAAAQERLGGLDGVVSNAGMMNSAMLKDLDCEGFDRAIAVNTRATWLLGKATHGMLSKSRGALVATGSISADHPTPPSGAYSTSKAALVMLIQQMALEWGPDGIRCNCVSPGPTLTDMTAKFFARPEVRNARAQTIPLRRLGTPEDVGSAIVYLLSPAAAYISGVNLAVDGGLATTLMPASRLAAGMDGQFSTPESRVCSPAADIEFDG